MPHKNTALEIVFFAAPRSSLFCKLILLFFVQFDSSCRPVNDPPFSLAVCRVSRHSVNMCNFFNIYVFIYRLTHLLTSISYAPTYSQAVFHSGKPFYRFNSTKLCHFRELNSRFLICILQFSMIFLLHCSVIFSGFSLIHFYYNFNQ